MENSYQGYDLKRMNNLFKELYEHRDPNYLEKKFETGKSVSPLTYFLKTYMNCTIQDVLTYKKIKNNSKEDYYVFVTDKIVALSKDYEDPCSLNFCAMKNPIMISIKIEMIENMTINKSEKFQIVLNITTTEEIKGNLM